MQAATRSHDINAVSVRPERKLVESRITRLATIGLDADVGQHGGIQRGQQAASSLSNVGGAAPDSQLTPQALADMNEEQFAALFNELQNSGNKEKLKQLFGH